MRGAALAGGGVAAAGISGYVATVTGRVTIDVGVGRRVRTLGPLTERIAAPKQTVFDLIAAPYLGRTPRALSEEVTVLERGTDMVLAAHRTPIGARTTAVTVETVRFESPDTVHFRLVRGPVPHVVERFDLQDDGDATVLVYTGELGTDGWQLGKLWGALVARTWTATVAASMHNIACQAERKHRNAVRARS